MHLAILSVTVLCSEYLTEEDDIISSESRIPTNGDGNGRHRSVSEIAFKGKRVSTQIGRKEER